MLKGKAGIVTGAGAGIGRAIAHALAQAGASVVVNDIAGAAEDGQRPAEAVAADIRASGGQAVANFASVADWDAAHEMVQQSVDAFGGLDFVVNNAGVVRDVIFHKMTEQQWDDVISVHLKGSFCMSRAAAPVLRAGGGGAIVNMTSTSGLVGSLGQVNYGTAKLGLIALTRGVALDMKRFGVRANAVAPFAWTGMTSGIPVRDDPVSKKRRANLQATQPEHVAPLVVSLVSDAAAEVNGQTFVSRGDEVGLFAPPEPLRSAHRSGGWTPEALAEVIPDAFATSFVPLRVTADLYAYDPIVR